jgi:dihydrofolate synthase / folylpolyglutamate synthase
MMTPRAAEELLASLELFGMKFGLDRMRALMGALGEPQRRFASIHVVGSNGKSSTVRYLAAILAREGLATGSYTSPHLVSFRERIELGEEAVSGPRFASAVEAAWAVAPEDVTQFELLTAAAYWELARAGVEVAVIEAGLGGRLDATNVIPSQVTVLTNVSLEHTRWLGPDTASIAREKLDVLRPGSVLVLGELDTAAGEVAEQVATERGARIVRVPAPPAPGYPAANLALAESAAEAFLGRAAQPGAVASAAADHLEAPGHPRLGRDPLTILDGAHNPAGARALARSLAEQAPVVLVVSVLEDKDAGSMLAELRPVAGALVATRCANPRALPAAAVADLARAAGMAAEVVEDPHEALSRARALAGREGSVVAAGSIYLVADLVRPQEGGVVSTI